MQVDSSDDDDDDDVEVIGTITDADRIVDNIGIYFFIIPVYYFL